MTRSLVALLVLATGSSAGAQAPPVRQPPSALVQKGVGRTGTMYDGNNTVRFPLARPPSANPSNPAAATPGVTGAQGSRDESGTGTGGGEH